MRQRSFVVRASGSSRREHALAPTTAAHGGSPGSFLVSGRSIHVQPVRCGFARRCVTPRLPEPVAHDLLGVLPGSSPRTTDEHWGSLKTLERSGEEQLPEVRMFDRGRCCRAPKSGVLALVGRVLHGGGGQAGELENPLCLIGRFARPTLKTDSNSRDRRSSFGSESSASANCGASGTPARWTSPKRFRGLYGQPTIVTRTTQDRREEQPGTEFGSGRAASSKLSAER